MKTPLHIEAMPDETYFDYVLIDANGRSVLYSDYKDFLDQIVALANSHAAQPGAPREDGSWIIRTQGGQEHIAYKRVEIRKRWYWESSNGIYIPEDAILAHRKHVPIEMPGAMEVPQ